MSNFKYALRHYSYHPRWPRVFATYSEHVTGKPLDINGKVATTIFLKTKAARDRALKQGWVDETEVIRTHLEPTVVEPKQPPKRKGRPKKG